MLFEYLWTGVLLVGLPVAVVSVLIDIRRGGRR